MKAFAVLFFVFCVTTIGFGQHSLSGIISDSTSGETLIGINVFLEGTALGSSTDIEGHYTINNIPDGKYIVRISCVGYEQQKIPLTFAEEKTQQLHVRLHPSVIVGDEVIITAQMRGQLAAINQQVSSNTIVNVVSEEKIQELPDANAASAIGRLPGVSLIRNGGEASKVILRGLSDKFSVVTVDGNRMAPTDANERGVDLSTISQGSLAGIELTKASTSDKDADAIAGSINLVTKKAPSLRTIRIEPQGSYNGLDKSANQYNFSGRYGERFFDDAAGLQLSANFERIIRSNESTDYNYNDKGNNDADYEISSFRPTYTNEIRKRSGGSLTIDFDTPDGGSIKVNTLVNRTSRNFLTSNRTYVSTGDVTYNYRDHEKEITTVNSSIHGENFLAGFKTDWNLAFSQAQSKDPFDFEMIMDEPDLDSSSMKAGVSNLSKGPVDLWIPYAWNNFRAATIYRANDNAQSNFDKEKSASLDLTKEYSLSDEISGVLKFGGKYRQKSRYAMFHQSRANYYLFDWPIWTKQDDGTVVMKNLAGTRFENLQLTGTHKVIFTNFLNPTPDSRDIYGTYTLYPLINRDALRFWRQLNINGYSDQTGNDPEYKNNVEVEGNDYSVTERVSAGYAMNTLNIGPQLSFITGFRIESDDNDYHSKFTPKTVSGFPFPTGELRDTTVVHTETVLLPNVHLIIRPAEFITLRIAAYKMLARPDFNHRLQKFVASSITGINTLTSGNPDLKNAEAWNYELQTQLYGEHIGLFSVSAFYKNIKNMYHTTNGILIGGQYLLDSLGVPWKNPFANDAVQFNLNFPYNSTRPTNVWGFEIEHQADLSFLPGYLSNIVLNYNFTIVRSETWVTTTKVVGDSVAPPPPLTRKVWVTHNVPIEVKQKLEEQPEVFGNASLGYDIDGFSFRISVFHQGSYNAVFSPDQRRDEVQDAYTRWDITVKQKVTDFIALTVNLNNITNTQEGRTYADRYHPEWILPNVNSRFGTTADLGIRVEL
ncbi:MAG: TonB-dependent receptor [Bacteroidota bacterium]